ncbi:MAG: hypothetical protein IPP06_09980 [Saprospiraceae bacterium]|nr:hypothetical protein [Candidatus Vicinibacter affinis]
MLTENLEQAHFPLTSRTIKDGFFTCTEDPFLFGQENGEIDLETVFSDKSGGLYCS